MSGKKELVEDIAKAEALLSRLEAEQDRARTRLAALRAELAALGAAQPEVRVHVPATPLQPLPQNPEEKVGLFQAYRGMQHFR